MKNLLHLSRRMCERAIRKSTLKYKGEIYTFIFDTVRGNYNVFDSGNNLLITINTKQITKAKRFLKYWIDN